MMGSVKAEVKGLRMRVLSTLLEKGRQSSEARPSEPGSPKGLGPVLSLLRQAMASLASYPDGGECHLRGPDSLLTSCLLNPGIVNRLLTGILEIIEIMGSLGPPKEITYTPQ